MERAGLQPAFDKWNSEYVDRERAKCNQSLSLLSPTNKEMKGTDVSEISGLTSTLNALGETGTKISPDMQWLLHQSRVSSQGDLVFPEFKPDQIVGYETDDGGMVFGKVMRKISTADRTKPWDEDYEIRFGEKHFSAHYSRMHHFQTQKTLKKTLSPPAFQRRGNK